MRWSAWFYLWYVWSFRSSCTIHRWFFIAWIRELVKLSTDNHAQSNFMHGPCVNVLVALHPYIELKKCLSEIYFVECVSKIKHILSVIHYTICGAVCFQFTHFPCDDWANIYTLSYNHHQIGSMNYYPLFRVRSWTNGVRCMSFYILMNLWYGRIASWDIRVLVVFAPNPALCHRHAALVPC